MNTQKRYAAAIISALLALGLTACGSEQTAKTESDSASQTSMTQDSGSETMTGDAEGTAAATTSPATGTADSDNKSGDDLYAGSSSGDDENSSLQ